MSVVGPRLTLALTGDSVLCGNGNQLELRLCESMENVRQTIHLDSAATTLSNDSISKCIVSPDRKRTYCSAAQKLFAADERFNFVNTIRLRSWILDFKICENGMVCIKHGKFIEDLCLNCRQCAPHDGCRVPPNRKTGPTVRLSGILHKCNMAEFLTVTGDVFGNIHFYNLNHSNAPYCINSNHSGMIFDLAIYEDLLFSISDDRSLRVFSVVDGFEISHSFANVVRPLVVHVFDRDRIFTGSADSVIYWFRLQDDCLRVMRRFSTDAGPIRSICSNNEQLIAGTYSGSLLSIQLSKPSARCEFYSAVEKILSFVRIREHIHVFLFENRELWMDNNGTQTLLMSEKGIKANSLMKFQQNLLFTSTERRAYVIDLANGSIQIVDEFPNATHSYAVVENFLFITDVCDQCHVFEHSNAKIRKVGCLVFGLKQRICSGSRCGTFIILGSTRGSIFVLNIRTVTIESTVTNAHLKKAVTDICFSGENVYSIGRDGMLRHFDCSAMPKLEVLSAKKIMEWPSRFIFDFLGSVKYIGGFHADRFSLIDFHTNVTEFTVRCGGGHRSWCYSAADRKLDFTKDGQLVTVYPSISAVSIITGPFHDTEITGAVTTSGSSPILITGGNDTKLIGWRIGLESFSALFCDKQNLSSIHDLSVHKSLLVSVGGRSEASLWQICNDNSNFYLKRLDAAFVDGDARLLSVSVGEYRSGLLAVVLSSSASIFFSFVDLDSKSCPKFSRFESFGQLNSVSSYSRVLLAEDSVVATTTNGFVLSFGTAKMELCSCIFAASTSLSSMAAYNGLLAVGSASGQVFVGRLFSSLTCSAVLHLSTVTVQNSTYVLSVGSDRRLVLSSISTDGFCLSQLKSLKVFYLNVLDPSRICLLEPTAKRSVDCIVVGCGIQKISVWF